MRCAVIGLGEVGFVYASALVRQGIRVMGYDPAPVQTPVGVERADDIKTAVAEADVVLVLTSAAAATVVAANCAPALKPGMCYADFTSASSEVKQEVAAQVGPAVEVADVAILGSIVTRGERTPLMAAGPGAPMLAEIMKGLGATVSVVDGPVGTAMAHKLLRSVFMKGLAAVIMEAVEAGRSVGYEEWIRDQIARELVGDGQATIDRFIAGSQQHAHRRAEEMEAAARYLSHLGVPNTMTEATRRSLMRLHDYQYRCD